MKRGDIVAIADPSAGDFARKPRPAPIVQCNSFVGNHDSVTVCLITSLTDLTLFRMPIGAEEWTGPLRPSETSIDKMQGVWTHRVGRRIGSITNEIMFTVDEALRCWLAL